MSNLTLDEIDGATNYMAEMRSLCAVPDGNVAKAYDTALAALRECAERRENKPLTLEQLRERDGESVWIPETEKYFAGHGIVNAKEEKVYEINGNGDYYPFDEYGAWLAYDYEPERTSR